MVECADTTAIESNGPRSSRGAAGAFAFPGPRHELLETRGRPEIDQLGKNVGQISSGIDAIRLASLDDRSNTGPVLGGPIVTREECIHALRTSGRMLRSTMLVSSSI